MKRFQQFWAVAAVALLLAGALFPAFSRDKSRGKTQSWAEGAAARKSDYYYLEALRQSALEKNDSYFDLLNTAWDLDSSDTEPGLNLGYYMIALGDADSLYALKGYNMMRRHFDTHPNDYYGAIFYGVVNDRLGNSGESLRAWQTLDSINPDNSDVGLKYAEALITSADSASLRRSIEVLNRIQRAEGADLGLTSHKVHALMALKDTAGVFAELKSYGKASPRDPNYYIFSGDVFDAYMMPDSALAYYNRACSVDSTSGIAYYKRAEFYKSLGDSAAYDAEVFKALKMETLDLDVKLGMLTSYVRELYTDSLQRPRIQNLFDELISQEPHEPEIRDLYASYFMAVNDFKGAAEQQEVALDANLSDPKRWAGVMSLWYSAGDYKKAAEYGEKSMEYFPNNGQLQIMLGGDYEMLDRWDDAMAAFRRALTDSTMQDDEFRSQVLAGIGDVFHHQQQPDSAFAYYEQSLQLNPDNAMALNNYAYYLALDGRDLDKAERYSKEAINAQPGNSSFVDTYAWVLFKKKDYVRAKEYIDQALAKDHLDREIGQKDDESDPDLYHHAGDIYYMNGDHTKALEFWTKALELEPDNALLKKKVKYKTHFFE